jgi:hypothetical protein
MDAFSGYLTYVNFGVLGLLVIALLTGFLYTKGYVDEMRDRHQREVDEYKQALALERQRNEIGELSGHMLRELVTELRKEIRP